MSKIQLSDIESLIIDKKQIVGCDEVGTGCIAGPLVVVGIRAPKGWSLEGLNDSKKLSEKKRLAMFVKLCPLIENKTLGYHLAQRSNKIIDHMGVAYALKDAYVEVFTSLYQSDCLIISDGILKFDNPAVATYDKVSLIKADGQIPAVMAASIIAKTYRDEEMRKHHHTYSNYGWDHNVGYGSKEHLAAIDKLGPTPLHRMSYAPLNKR